MSTSEAPLEIVSYDPTWPARFEDEAATLREVLRPWLTGAIEHIGSTAVPDLAAKPIIDIMVPVQTLDASRPAIEVLTAAGYCYYPYRPEAEHWFCKPSPQSRTHHLHLIPRDSRQWAEAIAFRDFLRSHAQAAADYEALKRRLAIDHPHDRDAYTMAKQPFIERTTIRALAGS
jgi:GrpB-like predicted nucleotidyltransferase (UPF0157 family)